jgi:hypothetical protein
MVHGDICVIIVIAINGHRVPVDYVKPMVVAIGVSILGVRSLLGVPVDYVKPMVVAIGVSILGVRSLPRVPVDYV